MAEGAPSTADFDAALGSNVSTASADWHADQTGLELAVFWGDQRRLFQLPATGEVTIGRAEGNTIRVDHASVSRHHVRLRIGSQLVVEDLGGANGTFIQDPVGAPFAPRAPGGPERQFTGRAESSGAEPTRGPGTSPPGSPAV